MSVHNTLHPPCLAPNQTLNGFMVHKVFKDKPIYVRPSVQILEPLSNRINKPEHLNDQEDLCIVQDDSSDDEFLRSAFTNEPPCMSSYQHPGVEEHSEMEVTNNPPALHETSLPSVGTISDCSHNNGNVQNEVQPEDPNSVDMSNISAVETSSEVLLENENLSTLLESENLPTSNIVIHRSNLKHNMIDAFCDEEILNSIVIVKVIHERGQMEKGEGRGVFRDILTGFWQEFFVSATVGANEKIPAIRHDYQSEQWKAIARVFVYGFLKKAFLLESFKAFLSVSEQEIVNEVVSGNMSPLDDDVMEFLSSYQCFTTPSENNIENIISQLAHKRSSKSPVILQTAGPQSYPC
ncbi:uncharacterized protein LOC124454769 [Xenia sp. Carnegie-2017]|uniref:uncharacterized protein LOC124454769 n=1 Tax=Xenia sp. Carnegie-2017 TaxID=2897299 RepID=UPI001F035B1E|nr:uncharacterized protein LOC124454769 [Xenia sp. Carnegie-2017]